MSKIIVTGGAGFIGSHITDELVAQGHEVIVIDNLLLGKKEFVNKKAIFKKVSILDYKKIAPLFKGAAAVFHLAADPRLPLSIEDPIGTHQINVTGTVNVLMAAMKAKVDKVIFSSSSAVYGNQTKLPIVETMQPAPLSPYGLHKFLSEEYCRLFSRLYGLKTVSLRYFNVFGPRKLNTGSYPMVIPLFLGQRQAGEPLTVVGSGTATRDYVHVSDVVRANMLAWKSNVQNGEVINIGSGRQVSVLEVAKFVGGEVAHIPERPGEMKAAQADITCAQKLLAWSPRVTFEEGMIELKKIWKVK